MRDGLVDIRKKNPTLWRNSMALAGCAFALAVNFWKYTPAFSPFGIAKWVPGVLFVVVGVWQLFFLTIRSNLGMVRWGQAAGLVVAIFWGTANTQQTQTFGGPASWQLPIMFAFYVVISVNTLFDVPINLLAEKK